MQEYMSLYEVEQKFMEVIDQDTGEVLCSEEEFDNLMANEENGIEYFIRAYKNKQAYAKALKDEETALKKRREAAEKAMENIKNRLDRHMAGQRYECPSGAINYRKSTTTDAVDLDAFLKWDGRFQYLEFDPKPKKKEIGEAIKAGTEIPGFVQTEHLNCSIG